ncbi:SusC/RagA family TonB-linked outer membrane protein [Terrimonas pollutisoli]|uniref:SusC/RagA family TonB-linked outer membrane protein n=1 Tax=Terrimonas pollutisoli TaxID=3034147 RepID=UPI0023EC7F00|nr:SusC/RagA family TonB-linked outer membrane protein [Terrimonas sp. H1YJ31]
MKNLLRLRQRKWKTYSFVLLLQLMSVLALAQVRITGKVTGPDGNGLSAISVTIRNTTLGTSTDVDGNYVISADLKPGTYILEFSGVGYKSVENSVKVETASSYTLDAGLLEDALSLDEVVVTGTNVRTSKKQLGNSISTISAKQLQNSGASNLSAILNGRIMGAQVTQNSGEPGGGVSIKLRGVGSVFGSSEPLYIVDGIIIDNSSANVINLNADAQGARIQTGSNRLVDINPNDIERIEVINGAAAAAIYGSRASNGVVQIFTKRGKNGQTKVSLFTSIQFNSLRKRLELNEEPFRFGYPGDARLSTVGDRLTTIANLRGDQATTPGTGPAALGGRLDQNKYPVTRYDYQDNIFNNSTGTDNHISVNGGNDKSSFYLSASYLKNEGIIRNTNFQRYGLRARGDMTINKWAKISGGAIYSNTSSKDLPNGNNFFSPISTMTIIDNVWNIDERDANGNLLSVERVRMNPLSVIEGYDLRQETNRVLTDVKLNLTPLKGLNIDFTNGFDTYSQTGNTYQARVPYENVSAAFFPDGYVSVARYNYFQWTSDVTASHKFDLLKDLQSTTSAGYSVQYIKTTYTAQEGRDLIPIVRTIGAAQNLFNLPIDTRTQQSIFGYFFQQAFGYKNKLFLTLAGRFDGSSAFSKDAQNIFYPKASLSYNISDEEFWRSSRTANWFNTLKLRASYGKAGNLTGVGAYDRFITYLPINYTGGGFAPRNRIGNVNIRPEIKEEWEGGADMQFFSGRLGLQITGYSQKITDLVLPFNIAPSNGAASLVDNLGEMTNKGIELMLTGTPFKTRDFRWDASLLFNKNKNKITKLYKNAGFIGFDPDPGTQGVLEGFPVGVYYVNYYARQDDGSLLLRDVNGFMLPQIERGDIIKGSPSRDANGQPTGSPLRKVLGDPNPDYTATFVNEFSYKNWSLRVQLDRVDGFEVYNWDWITRNNVGNGKLAEKELRGELPRGWVAAIGGFIGPRIQEDHVQDGTFTKLRELALSYTLDKLKFAESIKVSLIGRNLVSWDDYVGFDPEISSAGQSIVRGDDFGAFPIPRTFQVSVIANF